MRARFGLLVFAGVMLFSTTSTRGDATITYTPNNDPIIYGAGVTYSLQNPSGPIASVVWTYQWDSCPGTWIPLTQSNTTQTQSVMEVFPGSFTVRCQITYGPRPGLPPPPPETPTIQVSVLPPDGVKVVSGNNVSVNPGQYNTTVFRATCQGQEVGLLVGFVQERITNATNAQGRIVQKDSGWVPKAAGSTKFCISGGSIVDMKRFRGTGSYWAAINVNQTFSTATQEIRFVITDPCGNQITYPLKPSFTVKMVKDSPDTYVIQHQQNPQ